MDLGSELRHARERLGLSLDDIAERTKIRAATLRAIEHDDFDRLPPPIFTRGFLKAYAREVGLDPDGVANRFAAALQAVDDARRDANPASAITDVDESSLPIDRSTVETAALIVAAGLLVVLLNRWQSPPDAAPRPDRADSPQAAATQGYADRDATVATTGSPPIAAPTPPAARRGLMRIELLPKGPCWVEATADGARVVYKLLNAGDRYALEGQEELILKVGDPAQFVFSIDGATGRSLGPAGQPTTVRITRANAHEFIAAR
jgi:transcriptional regulator with XRE-family HTH domain